MSCKFITIGVWSKSDNKNISRKSYGSATDEDIFECIDLILKIDFTLARIDFDVKAGSGKYEIYINMFYKGID